MADTLLRRSPALEPDKSRNSGLLLTANLMQSSSVREECKTRHHELRQIIDQADDRWKTIEARLQNIADSIQSRVSQQLSTSKGEPQTPTSIEDGSKQMIRSRLHYLFMLPLKKHMADMVDFASSTADAKDRNLMADLSAECDSVLDTVEAAAVADKALDKSIKQTEKTEKSKGVLSMGMQDTKAVAAIKLQRPGIWETPRRRLQNLSAPVERLRIFVEQEMSADQLARRLDQAPGIVLRAASDWHFDGCVNELDQLQTWWNTTKCVLSGNVQLWDGLQNKEGLFIQRVEKGLEEITERKRRYAAYANFGNSAVAAASLRQNLTGVNTGSDNDHWTPKLDESLKLVSHVLSEMREGLDQIRNSAMWRIVESGRQIQKELTKPVALWDTVTPAQGSRAVLSHVEKAGAWPERNDSWEPVDEDFLEEMLLVAMRRLDCLIEMSTEVRDFFDKKSVEPRDDIFKCCDTLAKLLADMNEELLAVLDEPSLVAVQEWLELWSNWDGTALADDLEDSLQQTPFTSLNGEAVELRQVQLMRLRGLHTMARTEQDVRRQLVSALQKDVTGGSRSPSRKTESLTLPLQMRKVEEVALLDALKSEPPPLMSARPTSPQVTLSTFGGSIPDSMRRAHMPIAPVKPKNQRTPTGEHPDVSLTELLKATEYLARSPSQLTGGLAGGAGASMRSSSRGTLATSSFTANEDLWNVCAPVSPVSFGQKRMSRSSSDPTLRAPRGIAGARDRDRDQPLPGVIRAPSVKYIDGERITLRQSASQTRLNPLGLRPGSSQMRAPSLAWG